jgi:hypothetical protein
VHLLLWQLWNSSGENWVRCKNCVLLSIRAAEEGLSLIPALCPISVSHFTMRLPTWMFCSQWTLCLSAVAAHFLFYCNANSSFWHFTIAVFTKSAMENKRPRLCNFWHEKTTKGSKLFGIFTSFYGIYTSSAYFTESQNGHIVTCVNWT